MTVIGAGGIGVDVAQFLTREPHQSLAEWKRSWGIADPAEVRGGLDGALGTVQTAEKESRAREVHLLQRKTSRIGAGLGKTTGWVHRAELKKAGVKQYMGVNYKRIDDAGLHISINGEPLLLEVETIVLCTGQESNRADLPEVEHPRIYVIGGADVAAELDAKQAIDQAVELAVALST